MKLLLAMVALYALGTLGAMPGARLHSGRCRRRVTYEDDGHLFDEQELALILDDPGEEYFERTHDDSTDGKYNYRTWLKNNKQSLLRNLGADHPVEVEGGKVCLMFIPVGNNCKPAVGIISERDVHRLRKLGSQFVSLKDTINNRAFMVECINRVAWLKWMKLEF